MQKLTPFEASLYEMLDSKTITLLTLRAVCQCSAQRARLIKARDVSLTLAEAAALLAWCGRRIPLPAECPPAPAGTHVMPLPRKAQKYQRVADESMLMVAVMTARKLLTGRMPDLATVGPDSDGCRAAAKRLYDAAARNATQQRTGVSPGTALCEFATRVSMAVLNAAAQTVGKKNHAALGRYCDSYPDALTTPYDLILRFAPQRVQQHTAADIFERWRATLTPIAEPETVE